jgi:hypothetical protein
VFKEKSLEIAASVGNHMKMAGEAYVKQIPLEVEVSIKDNWQEK